jgi:hypothetical protein
MLSEAMVLAGLMKYFDQLGRFGQDGMPADNRDNSLYVMPCNVTYHAIQNMIFK